MKNFRFLLKYSYRNLWRSPKRTFILLLSLMIGTAFIIWDLNFANSGSKEVMKDFLSQYSGRYHITHPEYYAKDNKKNFNNYKIISDDSIQDPAILETSTKRVTAPIFISGQKKTLGVLLTGIDVQKELKLNRLKSVVKAGAFLSPLGRNQLIVGKRLAERIEARIGDEVAVVSQALDGSIANDLYQIIGLLDFGGGDLEEALAFTQLQSAQEFLSMSPDQYHQRVSFDMDHDTVPKFSNLSVTRWDELLPEIGISIRFIDQFTWVVSMVIVLVLSLGLSNSLMITFFEREEEFQTLNIIGAKASWVTISLLIEVFILGTTAILLGVLLGQVVTTYCYYFPINIQLFTGGKPIIMGGMVIKPLVRIYPVTEYYWKIPLMIYSFLIMTMIYPLIRVIRRSRNAIST